MPKNKLKRQQAKAKMTFITRRILNLNTPLSSLGIKICSNCTMRFGCVIYITSDSIIDGIGIIVKNFKAATFFDPDVEGVKLRKLISQMKCSKSTMPLAGGGMIWLSEEFINELLLYMRDHGTRKQ